MAQVSVKNVTDVRFYRATPATREVISADTLADTLAGLPPEDFEVQEDGSAVKIVPGAPARVSITGQVFRLGGATNQRGEHRGSVTLPRSVLLGMLPDIDVAPEDLGAFDVAKGTAVSAKAAAAAIAASRKITDALVTMTAPLTWGSDGADAFADDLTD